MKKLKNLLFLYLITTMLLTTPILAKDTTSTQEDYYKEISYGTYNGTSLKPKYILKKEDGTKVNFYVENNASEPLLIKINDISERILKPGEKGHISANVTKKSSEFEFICSAGGNGGDINVNYIIRQRN